MGSVYLRLQYSGLASTLSLSPKQASNVLHLAVGVPGEFAKITDDLQQHFKTRMHFGVCFSGTGLVGLLLDFLHSLLLRLLLLGLLFLAFVLILVALL